jgi:valyl-tRNA synthetase
VASTLFNHHHNLPLGGFLPDVEGAYKVGLSVSDGCLKFDAGIIDIAAEKKRLSGERDRVSKVLVGLKAKLDNPNFADRAPEDVVQQTKEQLTNMTSQLTSLEQNLEALS